MGIFKISTGGIGRIEGFIKFGNQRYRMSFDLSILELIIP